MTESSRRGRLPAILAAMVIHPIAWPGSLIEKLVRIWIPAWEFNVYTATPYFLILTTIGAGAIVSDSGPLAFFGVYILSAIELLALWTCLTIAIGISGTAMLWLNVLGKRVTQVADRQIVLTPRAFYGGFVAFGFTAFYFASLATFIEWLTPNSYLGLRTQHGVERLLELFYFSVVTIVTLGYGDIVPVGVGARLLVVLEVAVGIFFIVFLFGTFTSYRVNQISSIHSRRISDDGDSR